MGHSNYYPAGMNLHILVIGLIGFFVSLLSHCCAERHTDDAKETMFFGTSIPWAFIGVIGYLLILLTSPWPMLTKGLAVIVALATVFLALKAVRLKLYCPVCVMVWSVNATFVNLAFAS